MALVKINIKISSKKPSTPGHTLINQATAGNVSMIGSGFSLVHNPELDFLLTFLVPALHPETPPSQPLLTNTWGRNQCMMPLSSIKEKDGTRSPCLGHVWALTIKALPTSILRIKEARAHIGNIHLISITTLPDSQHCPAESDWEDS